MKKTLTIILFFSFVFTTYSQSNKSVTSFNANTLKNARTLQFNNTKIEKEKQVFFLEIKVIKSKKSTQVIFPEYDMSGITDKKILKKLDLLTEIEKKNENEQINLLNETNKIGLNLMSHSFNFLKDNEIHYYIFEL